MYIQDAPICIYWRSKDVTMCPSWSMVLFHRDFLPLSFEEFCLNIVIPKVEQLQSDGFDVQWGYVSDSNNHWQSLEHYKQFLRKEIEHAKANV
jgi:hypothetical protein